MTATATHAAQPGPGPFVAQTAGLGVLGFGFPIVSAGLNPLSLTFGVSLLLVG